MSRSRRPKQLLALTDGRTMIEETLARIRPLCSGRVRPLVVTGQRIAGPIRAALGSRQRCEILTEPVGKDTAPAVLIAALAIEKRYGPAVMLVLAADHAISPESEYLRSVRYAARVASEQQRLVVFGIPPSRPDTGYGYVEVGKPLNEHDTETAYAAKRFVEKPDWQTAVRYCRSGRYLWNSGMFVCDKVSVDYAIMERCRRVAVVTGHFLWDDVGSWDAVPRVRPGNERGTTVAGKRVYEAGCGDTVVFNDSTRAVAAIGLDNAVVVVTEDAVLVAARSELPALKKHLAAMKADGRFGAELF